ncbi:MAG: lipoprotein [Aquabacterium sp.]|nr:lipoprotein [Aquabacterium sp.]
MREVAARSATRAALLLALLGSLAGCGQKGPLYLPHGAPAAARPAPSAQGTPAAPALSAASAPAPAPAPAAASGDAGPANPAAAAR